MAHHVIRHLKRLATIKYILSLCTDQHKNNKQSTEKHVFYVLRCLQIKYYCKLVKAAFFTFINLDNEKTVFFPFYHYYYYYFHYVLTFNYVWFFSSGFFLSPFHSDINFIFETLQQQQHQHVKQKPFFTNRLVDNFTHCDDDKLWRYRPIDYTVMLRNMWNQYVQ